MPSKKPNHDVSIEKSDESFNDTDAAMSFPDLLADPRFRAMQAYQQLPSEIRRRVKSLKKLQFESYKVEADFFRRMNDLEREFQERFAHLYATRTQIVTGEKEPTDSECDWAEDELDLGQGEGDHEVQAVAENLKNKAVLHEQTGDNLESQSPVGVPNFWLTVFNNVPMLADHKEECDDPILASLRDIQCFIQPSDAPRPGFYLEFHFAPNEYFTNTMLKKEYFVRFDPSAKDPLEYEGPEIIESKGCTINWKPGKNVTVRTIKKTMKNKNREKKTVTKTVKTDSFFNFFDPPQGCLDNLKDEDEEDDIEEQLHADFELGQYIREQVIPRAVLLFTGEGIDFDDDDYGSDEEKDEDDDDDDHPNRPLARSNRRRGNSGEEQQCKQQ